MSAKSDPTKDSLQRALNENTRLRFLCIRFIDDLRPPRLMPGEHPNDRLDYLIRLVDDRTAVQVVFTR